jgi:RNA polymerase sigma-70 factor (ECF subfamily)
VDAQSLYLDKHAELVDRCKIGDRKAQYEIYRLYSKTMLNVAMRIVNHLAEAEDVLQDAFLDAFQKINDFKQTATFGAWLKQIVVNRALNQLRQRKVQFSDIEDIKYKTEHQSDGYSEVLIDEQSPDEEDIQLDIQKVKWGIEQLPDGYRTVLSLYLLEGYDHEEIAQILGLAESSTRTQYIRAKKKLLDIIKMN